MPKLTAKNVTFILSVIALIALGVIFGPEFAMDMFGAATNEVKGE